MQHFWTFYSHFTHIAVILWLFICGVHFLAIYSVAVYWCLSFTSRVPTVGVLAYLFSSPNPTLLTLMVARKLWLLKPWSSGWTLASPVQFTLAFYYSHKLTCADAHCFFNTFFGRSWYHWLLTVSSTGKEKMCINGKYSILWGCTRVHLFLTNLTFLFLFVSYKLIFSWLELVYGSMFDTLHWALAHKS